MLLQGKHGEARVFDSGAMAKGLEITAATFTPGNMLLFGTGEDMLADDDALFSGHPFNTISLVHYDLKAMREISSLPLEKPVGSMMAGDGYTVIFSPHRAVVETATMYQ